MKIRQVLNKALVPDDVREMLHRIPKPVGSFGWDPWGYNEEGAAIGLSMVKWLYDNYFRVEATGRENIPSQGRVLFVANHSGQLPMDGMLLGTALATNPNGPRAPRAMIERFFPSVPFVGNILNMFGAVIGDPVNCAKMLESDEAIIVFPEGVRGSGKLYRDRYQLKRFGNGFMHLALNHSTPIIPVGVVGCEETMPAIANIAPLAKMLGVPYIPVVPAPFPLPAKVFLNFGKPMVFEADVDTEEAVTAKVEKVKDEIRSLIRVGLKQRGDKIF